MKRPGREITIFNLSMLDVITGALGAIMVLMIILLTQKIGIESMTCQDVKSELVTAAAELSKTTAELEEARKELQKYQGKRPETIDKISTVTRIINSTADKLSGTLKKIAELKKEIFRPSPEAEALITYKIPYKIVMLLDLSGSMAPQNNKYREDRLSQVKAAVKMLIAAMNESYWMDIVYFPAFSENINRTMYPDFRMLPKPGRDCLAYDSRDEAYDKPRLSCYKYGYFEGKLVNMISEKEKIGFYKKIACLDPYHDTPTEAVLEFVLTTGTYADAEGIILFSDGQPDSLRKKIMTKEKLLASIKKMNRAGKKIFTVGIGTEFRNQEDSEAVDFLKELAAQNNGFYIGF